MLMFVPETTTLFGSEETAIKNAIISLVTPIQTYVNSASSSGLGGLGGILGSLTTAVGALVAELQTILASLV